MHGPQVGREVSVVSLLLPYPNVLLPGLQGSWDGCRKQYEGCWMCLSFHLSEQNVSVSIEASAGGKELRTETEHLIEWK